MNKFFFLFSKFFLFFSLLVFVFIIFKFKAYDFKNLDKNTLKYTIFFGCIFFSSVIYYFINNNLKGKIFLIFFSITISFYAIESYLNYKDYISSVKYYAKKNKNYYDDRSRYEYYINRKSEDKSVVISMPPFIIHRDYFKFPEKYKLLPLGGISKKITIFCNESGKFVEYFSDRYGFNNPDDEWEKEKHIFFLGDSYAHGVCVDQEKTITGKIRDKKKSNNLGFINLGQRGNGPLSELGSFLEYSKITNIQKVFWLYYEGNDLKNLRYENKIKFLNNYINKENFLQDLVNQQELIDNYLYGIFDDRLGFEKRTSYYLKENKFFVFLKLKKFRDKLKKIKLNNKKNYKKEIKKFEEILIKAKKEIRNLNAELYFVYIPTYQRFNNLSLSKEDEQNYKEIKSIVNELEIEFIDLNSQLLKKVRNPKNIYPYGLPKHFNEKGYENIAEILYEYIF